MPFRILIPVDFSEHDEVLFRAARLFLSESDATVVQLLHVVQPEGLAAGNLAMEPGLDPAAVAALRSGAEAAIAERAAHPLLDGMECSTRLLPETRASLAEQISIYAAQEGFHLVLALSKHRAGVERFLESTELMRIIRKVNVPILCVSPGKVPRIQRILFATDLGEEAASVVVDLAPIARRLGADITLARVSTRRGFQTTREFRSDVREFREAVMLADPELSPLLGECINYYDDELAKGIVHCAEDHLADLIVLATHGRTGLSLLFGGSVTEDVVERARLPVLVYRLPEAD